VLGTTIISSMGTALWTINFSTIFIALSLLLLARYETKKSDTAHPIFLGILFFLAFFSRPSAAAFIVAALAYLLVKERRQFLVAASVSFLLLILFTAWSRLEYGLWQPPYYSIARLQAERVSIWTGLIGNLISPSRGIFVFSPFFLLIIPGVLYVGRKLIRQPLMWMAVSWFVLSLILNARAVVWWGGDSFGPRLMTENVLALVLLVIIIWKAAGSRLERRTKWIAAVFFSVLGLAAIFINSYQGLYNPDMVGWNLFVEHQTLPPQTGLGDIFDWKNPQFLASADHSCRYRYQRIQELLPYESSLEAYRWGEPISHYADQTMDFRREAANEANWRLSTVAASMPEAAPPTYLPQVYLPVLAMSGNKALLVGWQVYDEQKAYRVSICPEAQIFFKLDDVSTSGSYELALSFGALGEQEVRVFVNGTKVDTLAVTNPIDQPQQFTIPFDGALLKPNSMNELSFEFPSSVRPNPGSYQLSAVAFYGAAIYPAGGAPMWPEQPNQEPISAAYP
jgi:hypothetical protein